MTGNSVTTGREAFEKSLIECVADINKMMPPLNARYDMTVILGAMAEQVGSALQALLTRKVCNAEQAQKVVQRLEEDACITKAAKLEVVGKPPGDGSPPEGTPSEGTPSDGTPSDENSPPR